MKKEDLKGIVVRGNNNSYENVCTFLKKTLAFEILNLQVKKNGSSIISKKEGFKEGIKSYIFLLKNISKIKEKETIISIGHYTSLFLFVLNKLHIIHPRKLYWWACFIHSSKMQRILKVILKPLLVQNTNLILFSKCEIQLYKEKMGISENKMISIPYGDWNSEGRNRQITTENLQNKTEENYYFSGGYSNRDYRSLLQTWTKLFPEKKLIIIGSKNNKDLLEYLKKQETTQKNASTSISVMLDMPSEEFDRYLIGARACILPFRENTGASGQSVTLRCMKYHKLIVSTDIYIMREYVKDRVSGFLLKDFDKDLKNTIKLIEIMSDSEKEKMKSEQDSIFNKKFAHEVITSRLVKTLCDR